MPRVLMATFRDWDTSMPLGAHSLAGAFVRAGWDVALVANPLSPVEALKDPREFARRLRVFRPWGRRVEGGRLWAHLPLAPLAPHNVPVLRTRAVHRRWQSLVIPGAYQAASRAGFESVDLLYVDSPIQLFWLDVLPHHVSMARIVDQYSAFEGVAPEVLDMEQELIRRVDLVAATSQPVATHVTSSGARRTLYLPNGVDFERFAHPDSRTSQDLAGIAAPVVLYVGQLRERLDWDLIISVAERMADVSFVFVGPGEPPDRVTAVRNIHCLGWRPPDSLPALIAAADVGIIPLDLERYRAKVDAIHPLKLYQYLAAGLPVVATRTTELTYMQSPALLFSSSEGCELAIRRALAGEVDPAVGTAYARAADWDSRLATLLEALDLVTETR